MLKNPKVCNKCNSPYWNVPPTRSNAKGAKGAKGGGYIVVPVPRKIALGIKKEASLKGHKKLAPYFREKFKNLEKIDDEEYAKFKAEREAKNLPVVA